MRRSKPELTGPPPQLSLPRGGLIRAFVWLKIGARKSGQKIDLPSIAGETIFVVLHFCGKMPIALLGGFIFDRREERRHPVWPPVEKEGCVGGGRGGGEIPSSTFELARGHHVEPGRSEGGGGPSLALFRKKKAV